jgi:hemoglobin-like flavoprotein
MSPVEVFRASLKRCLAKPEFLLDFYGIFMASSDEVRQKFQNTDLKRQTEILADSLWVMANVAASAKDSAAWDSLPRLAEKHDRAHLDIRPELYDVWLNALVETARRHDPLFTAKIESDWRETLAVGIDYLRTRH